jgi:hypothetical protein
VFHAETFSHTCNLQVSIQVDSKSRMGSKIHSSLTVNAVKKVIEFLNKDDEFHPYWFIKQQLDTTEDSIIQF